MVFRSWCASICISSVTCILLIVFAFRLLIISIDVIPLCSGVLAADVQLLR